MTRVLRQIRITFLADGIEYAVTYAHQGEPPPPGSRKRTTTAARMAARALQAALEELENGEAIWGGLATNTRESEDSIIVERKENAA